MKIVILAGGYGTRLSEETILKPKPMVEIGEQPILWHIMKVYSFYGFNEFVICLGYKGNVIKEFFYNYFIHESDFELDVSTREVSILRNPPEHWKITMVDTGLNTNTGGRIKRIKEIVGNETFMMTYGDGVSDLDIKKLVNFHRSHGKLVTVTAVLPPGRFGVLAFNEGDSVSKFLEKPLGDGLLVNGGFFVLEPTALDYIDDDNTSWESDSLPKLAEDGQLMAYRHLGFWRMMDTMRDKRDLEAIWSSGNAPWKVWDGR